MREVELACDALGKSCVVAPENASRHAILRCAGAWLLEARDEAGLLLWTVPIGGDGDRIRQAAMWIARDSSEARLAAAFPEHVTPEAITPTAAAETPAVPPPVPAPAAVTNVVPPIARAERCPRSRSWRVRGHRIRTFVRWTHRRRPGPRLPEPGARRGGRGSRRARRGCRRCVHERASRRGRCLGGTVGDGAARRFARGGGNRLCRRVRTGAVAEAADVGAGVRRGRRDRAVAWGACRPAVRDNLGFVSAAGPARDDQLDDHPVAHRRA